MTDVKILKSLTESKDSGVKLLKNHEMTLSLDKDYHNYFDHGVTKVLASKYLEFEPSLNGVLLNKEDCRNITIKSEINEDVDSFQVSLQANFYVFAPAVGNHLIVKVQKVGAKWASAQALESFKVNIQKLPTDCQLQVGQTVTIKIVSMAYSRGIPDIIGEYISTRQEENGGIMTDSSETPKRKIEESHKKKKKVKRTDEINDDSVLMETTNVPSTPKSGAKTPKDKFKLPDGFKVLEKKTEKKSWKEYEGPDGRRYRSLVEIQRVLTGNSNAVASTADEANNLDEPNIEVISNTVENIWRIAEDGSLTKNKKKLYKSDILKSFPKKALYFSDEKSEDESNGNNGKISSGKRKKGNTKEI